MRLVQRHGSATSVLHAALRPDGVAALLDAGLADDGGDDSVPPGPPLLPRLAAEVVAAARAADATLLAIARAGLEVITSEDVEYPDRLLALELPPPVLHVRGDWSVLAAAHPVAVVGTRRATEAGRWTATRIAEGISRSGGVVVSGLALGIDGAAHWAAVDSGAPTVAVLGSGHGRLYPRAHVRLAERIVETGGAVVSELAPDVTGNQGTFPRRNRVISGLAKATVVIEAPAGSGALITAGWALEQGRECFLVPGAFGSASAARAVEFLRAYHGQARIVSTVTGLLDDLGLLDAAGPPALVGAAGPGPLGSVEARIAAGLGEGPSTVDELVVRTRLPVATVLSALTLLEMRGVVVAAYGRYRARNRPAIGRARSGARPARRQPVG
jgi:DNA processing protein